MVSTRTYGNNKHNKFNRSNDIFSGKRGAQCTGRVRPVPSRLTRKISFDLRCKLLK